jgi:hypothetical protein
MPVDGVTLSWATAWLTRDAGATVPPDVRTTDSVPNAGDGNKANDRPEWRPLQSLADGPQTHKQDNGFSAATEPSDRPRHR